MRVLLQYFDSNSSLLLLSNHCLCNGYSTLCSTIGIKSQLKQVGKGRWSLFDLGINNDHNSQTLSLSLSSCSRSDSIMIEIKIRDDENNIFQSSIIGFDIMRCYHESLKKRFRPGLYSFNGVSKAQSRTKMQAKHKSTSSGPINTPSPTPGQQDKQQATSAANVSTTTKENQLGTWVSAVCISSLSLSLSVGMV